MTFLKTSFKAFILNALNEDAAFNDITTQAVSHLTQHHSQSTAMLLAKQDGILAGLELLSLIFECLGGKVKINFRKKDGAKIHHGEVIAHLTGPAKTILSGERVALNLLQHLSGIATLTAQHVAAIKGTKAKILDTRKTLPFLRHLEKYAVKMGGALNHRMDLADAYMIKENHIAMAGSLAAALAAVNSHQQKKRSKKALIVEVTGIGQLRVALQLKVKHILLDNFSLALLKKAVEINAGAAKLEASGGVSLATVRKIAETGVDFISIGRLTHSAPSLDISLLIT